MQAGDDDELMAAVASADRHAFATLVGRHLDRSVAVAERMLGDRHDAEDVAQETFAKIWAGAAQWRRGGAKFTTWLHRVVVNAAIDRLRRRRSVPFETAGEPVDAQPSAFHRVHRAEVARQVAAAVQMLPERQRAALVLCHYEGLGNAEAAEVMNVSVGALESLLIRAKRTLRERLAHLMDSIGEETDAV
jgi:RNA polymerase sigma-70 factor (ECF subfamily)